MLHGCPDATVPAAQRPLPGALLPSRGLQAEKAYRAALESYSSNPKLVRLYAKFREGIKADPWGAEE